MRDYIADEYMNIGPTLRQFRKARGWSQQALADRAKPCSRSYISQVETGKRDPTWTWVCAILQTLGVVMVLRLEMLPVENGHLSPDHIRRLILGVKTIGDKANGKLNHRRPQRLRA